MLVSLRNQLQKAKPLLAGAVETLFPARCAACREAVSAHGSLCAPCWQSMHFIADPLCFKCGLPFEYNIGRDALCGACMKKTPAFTEARAVFRYDENSKSQVMALKYYDKTQLAPVFGDWLARLGRPYAQRAEVIIPVPLHYFRLLMRRYNQAALLAYTLSDRIDLPVLPDTLARTRPTTPQAGLSRRQREDNVRGAFTVPVSKRAALKGKSVLLVDDVMTTGATLDACARALHDGGAIDVFVLTLARTVIGD